MIRTTALGGALTLFLVTGVQPTYSQIVEGNQAPMFRGVDENLRLVDMADFIDGAPLVFLYTSAT